MLIIFLNLPRFMGRGMKIDYYEDIGFSDINSFILESVISLHIKNTFLLDPTKFVLLFLTYISKGVFLYILEFISAFDTAHYLTDAKVFILIFLKLLSREIKI